jgi:hypothetical protein
MFFCHVWFLHYLSIRDVAKQGFSTFRGCSTKSAYFLDVVKVRTLYHTLLVIPSAAARGVDLVVEIKLLEDQISLEAVVLQSLR